MATTFRSWRTNFLIHGAAGILEVIVLIIVAIVNGSSNSAWFSTTGGLQLGLLGGGIVLAGVSVWLMFYIKNWWYNYDDMGVMRYEEFDFFGTDEDFVEPEETEENAEDESEEEQLVEETEDDW